MLMSSIHPTNWQVIYRSADGSYGERSRAEWEEVEQKAKRKGRGMWADGGKGVDPAAYKRAQRGK